MPFYRSVLQDTSGGGGGGGGGSSDFPYFSFESDVEDLDIPVLESFYFNNYTLNQEAVSEINKVVIGNKVTSAGYMFSNWTTFNAPVDLRNAELLRNADYMVQQCNNFDSPVLFPIKYNGNSDYGLGISYGSMFSYCTNYNCPTTIRAYDSITNMEENTYVNVSYMFYHCYNFNSRVVFDFYKENVYFNDNYDYSLLTYDATNMFYNCRNFNQPLVFPYGISGFNNYMFYNCNKFNQPLVVDFFQSGSYGTNLWGLFGSYPNMASDLIFINAEYLYVNSKWFFDSILNNNRTKMTNIYIRNVPNIYNSNVVSTSNNIVWTITQSPYNANCNVYTNSTYKITISEDIEAGLNSFNNYYYNFYGEYPVIPHVPINNPSEEEDSEDYNN